MYFDEIEGVRVIGYAEETGLSYEFHQFVVVEKDDVYYWSSDTGCSCPSPFESHQFPGDFDSGNPVTALNALTEWSSGLQVEDDGLRTKLMNAKESIQKQPYRGMGTGNAL